MIIMNFGVAFSGCDISAISAFAVLEELRNIGINPTLVSTTSLPAVSLLDYCYRLDYTSCYEKIHTLYSAILSGTQKQIVPWVPAEKSRIPIVISTVDIITGDTVLFSSYQHADCGKLFFRTAHEFPTFSSSMPYFNDEKIAGYDLYRLCDYSVCYGNPIIPLKIRGVDRIISFSFYPQETQNPYQISYRKIMQLTNSYSDLNIQIISGYQSDFSYLVDNVRGYVCSYAEDIYRLL